MKRFAAVLVGVGVAGIALAACNGFSATSDPPPISGDAAVEATPDGAAPDGATPDASSADAGVAPCRGAFGPLTLQLQGSADYLVDSVALSTDERDAYVTLFPTSSVKEMRGIFAMHRDDPMQAFALDTSQPRDLGDSGPTPSAFDVGWSADEATLYFSHRQDSDAGVLGVDIYRVDRASNGALTNQAKFGLGINDPSTNQFHAHPAGPRLYFTVAPIVGGAQGQRDLYVAPLDGATGRVMLAELNDPLQLDANPVPSRDELEIFFASDRASHGVDHVYLAQRESAALTFGAPTPVTFPSQDAGVSLDPQDLSADRCRLYVLMDRKDLYVSTRSRE